MIARVLNPETTGLGWPETTEEQKEGVVSRETNATPAGLGWPE